MVMNYILPWIRSRKSGVTERGSGRIQNLKDKLVKLGYRPSEIDYIIKKVTGTSSIKGLTAEQIKKVETELDEQLRLGSKCIELINPKSK